MNTYAHFVSRKTNEGFQIFRHSTEFHADGGAGKAIGLVVMMNPGDARPEDESIFESLQTSEYETVDPVLTKQDNTMKKLIGLIQKAYKQDNQILPPEYTIHIENIFNLREKNSDFAKKYAKKMTDFQELMFKRRAYEAEYDFVFLAWGKLNIFKEHQIEYQRNFPNAIRVNKKNINGTLREVDYPVHPLFMNTDLFLEASKGSIKKTYS